ncbi:hypothetical protein [Halopseudomonas sp.]|uniref:hypothetical protein n=1 Tax=Halopseudomonas sp. TaxID=2901191 RepID=UPI003567F41E
MLKDLTNFTKKPSQNKLEQLMSMGGGVVLLRKGLTRPGIIGAVSLAVGAYALYCGYKAYRDHQDNDLSQGSMATRAGASEANPETAGAPTTPATPVKSPLG